MATSTRIKYTVRGQDTVTHNAGYPSAQQHSLALVGANSWSLINSSSGLEGQMEILLGNRDLAEIEKVYKWISGMKPYLLRLNAAPKQDIERMAGLGCHSDSFGINCDGIDSSGPSRGVVVAR